MDMEISNAHNQQEMPATEQQQQQQQQHNQENKKPRPHPEQALPCPRCESTNTKFCYYNNYSLTQPRYFCKACRRYWTRGGSLRNVPVGGGCRKNHHKIKSKKPSSSSSTSTSSSNSSSSSSSSKQTLELDHLLTPNMNPTSLLPLSFDHHPIDHMMSNFMLPYPNSNPNPLGFLDILRGSGGGLVDNSSMQSLCFGFGGHDQMFNTIDGGLLNSANSTTTTTTTTTNTTAIAMDHGGGDSEVVDNVGGTHDQWGPLLGGDHGSLGGMDSSRDHYWNSNNKGWHGLINSSLM